METRTNCLITEAKEGQRKRVKIKENIEIGENLHAKNSVWAPWICQ